jgi:hypothetical protein
MAEPIRQVGGDGVRENLIAQALAELYKGWKFYSTPRFYFTDYHVTRVSEGGRENYLGDLEVKWLNIPSTTTAIFPFNKLQQMLIAPPYVDNYETYHRICFRFTDGLLLIPAQQLAHLMPEFYTRKDTQERDLVVYVNAQDPSFKQYWHDRVVSE